MKAKGLVLIISFIIVFINTQVFAGQRSYEDFWVELKIEESVANFRINVPERGCVSIISTVPGRRVQDRIWGPTLMDVGTYRLQLPAERILNRSGSVKFFNLDVRPTNRTGQRGRGERQFNKPMGIDHDNTRNEVFVADTGNDRIVRLSSDGRFLGSHGGFGMTFSSASRGHEDSLDNPYDVAVGGYSNFYVSDKNNHRIAHFDSYRTYRGNLYPRDDDRRNRPDRPRGLRVDPENNIWMVDGRADKVLKITAGGDRLMSIGGFGYSTQQLKDPTHIDINSRGEVFVADRGNARIAVFDRLGAFLHQIRGRFESPSGLALDSDGLIYITDDKKNKMFIFTPAGKKVAAYSQADDGSLFDAPSAVAVSDSKVYLLDSGNHRIIHFTRSKTGYSMAWQAQKSVLE